MRHGRGDRQQPRPPSRRRGRWWAGRRSSPGSPRPWGTPTAAGVVVSAGRASANLASPARRTPRPSAPAPWPSGPQATRSSATIPLGAFAGLIPDDVRSDDAARAHAPQRRRAAHPGGRAQGRAGRRRRPAARSRVRGAAAAPDDDAERVRRRDRRRGEPCRTRSSRCGRTPAPGASSSTASATRPSPPSSRVRSAVPSSRPRCAGSPRAARGTPCTSTSWCSGRSTRGRSRSSTVSGAWRAVPR